MRSSSEADPRTDSWAHREYLRAQFSCSHDLRNPISQKECCLPFVPWVPVPSHPATPSCSSMPSKPMREGNSRCIFLKVYRLLPPGKQICCYQWFCCGTHTHTPWVCWPRRLTYGGGLVLWAAMSPGDTGS